MPTRLISLRLPRDLAARVATLAQGKGWTRTRVVVEAVRVYLEEGR
jgi:predicted DNA-binding protein